ncbi:WbqC family protein [Christiangramia portivictoriae]|uniref:WbqC family protein n=1 Tax=Christiangramia portivictoriae TaxID=326069 RepID=UPI0004166D4D|nr:WbqC family protein [Christiangramia portivictoriae]
MDPVLLHPSYFGPVSQWVAFTKAEAVVFESEDNYQKQTYRNRMYIYDANGKLTLNIPIKHSAALGLPKSTRQKYRDIQIENAFPWQLQHWRAFKASYQTSPFFEFYEDELQPLYDNTFKYLLDFNYRCMEFVADALQVEWSFDQTADYVLHPEGMRDHRALVNAKSDAGFMSHRYPQVFEDKKGFINNLCVLDLIFNEGPASLAYLQEQNL